MNHQIVAMQGQLLGAEQSAAAQQQANIARGQMGSMVDPMAFIASLFQTNQQLIEMVVQLTGRIAQDRDAPNPGFIGLAD